MSATTAFKLESGKTRSRETLDVFGDRISIKLNGADTDGQYAVFEDVTQPSQGPPLHRHQREDEFFYILEGEYVFEVDGDEFLAGPGDSVFAPRGSEHSFQNVGTRPGRTLVVVQPAGFEVFLAELSEATRGMEQPDMSVVVPIFEKYGLELLGPPKG